MGGLSGEVSYGSWRALELAIRDAARKRAREAGVGVRASTVDAQIRQVRFDRFLSRVFADGEQSGWMLKGGMGLLARVATARTTTDVDLAVVVAADLVEAEVVLARAVDVDLGDHMTFRLIGSQRTGLGENQPGVLTRRYAFACIDTDTDTVRDRVHVDVVVGPAPVGRPEVVEPANRLRLGRPLITYPYVLYPVSDQIADKVCATMSTYGQGRVASSRVKDLVDLVVLARTQRVDLDELRAAIAVKRALSKIPAFERLQVPEDWRSSYVAVARGVPGAAGLSAAEAEAYVAQLVDPALAPAGASAAVWVPGSGWTALGEVENVEGSVLDDGAAGGDVYVRHHTRMGSPVRQHWRAGRGTAKGSSSGDEPSQSRE